MEDLFNMLSSAAKLDKRRHQHQGKQQKQQQQQKQKHDHDDIATSSSIAPHNVTVDVTSKKRGSVTNITNSNITSSNQQQVHREQMAAFRRSMHIKVSNKHDPDLPDAISSFQDIAIPSWWNNNNGTKMIHHTSNHEDSNNTVSVVPTASTLHDFMAIQRVILHNIEQGRWKEPTPIQMQAIPTLLERRDLLACAPTGSGKSGAFIIPALILSHPSQETYYYYYTQNNNNKQINRHLPLKGSHKINDNKIINRPHKNHHHRQGEIRSLLLAPSRELAAQLHREVDRLGRGKPNHHGSISSILLMKSNAAHVIAGTVGGKNGLDVLVTTPLRLIDALDKGLRLDTVRLVVLDEADRLLDAADGRPQPETTMKTTTKKGHKIKQHKDNKTNDSSSSTSSRSNNDEETSDDDEKEKEEQQEDDDNNYQVQSTSGSHQTQSFLAQMDIILSAIPTSAVRALFSATVTQTVKLLSESILRNPVDVTVSSPGSAGGANTDIDQELLFVGREEGKLLALRQLKQRGQFKPPIIVFVQSQERAQALFGELLYDGFHVDVIHAGRSRTARDNAVAKFRRGETWVLICTDLVARGVDFKAVNMVINYDLPTSGITYVHRIGRCGRAGRHGRAITLFTEADFDHLRTIANVMKQSGCQVDEWMLQLKRGHHSNNKNKKKHRQPPPRRSNIDTTPRYDKKKRLHKLQMIQESKRKKQRTERKQMQQGQEEEKK